MCGNVQSLRVLVMVCVLPACEAALTSAATELKKDFSDMWRRDARASCIEEVGVIMGGVGEGVDWGLARLLGLLLCSVHELGGGGNVVVAGAVGMAGVGFAREEVLVVVGACSAGRASLRSARLAKSESVGVGVGRVGGGRGGHPWQPRLRLELAGCGPGSPSRCPSSLRSNAWMRRWRARHGSRASPDGCVRPRP